MAPVQASVFGQMVSVTTLFLLLLLLWTFELHLILSYRYEDLLISWSYLLIISFDLILAILSLDPRSYLLIHDLISWSLDLIIWWWSKIRFFYFITYMHSTCLWLMSFIDDRHAFYTCCCATCFYLTLDMLWTHVLHVFTLRTTHGHLYIIVARILVFFSLSLNLLTTILLDWHLSILKPVDTWLDVFQLIFMGSASSLDRCLGIIRYWLYPITAVKPESVEVVTYRTSLRCAYRFLSRSRSTGVFVLCITICLKSWRKYRSLHVYAYKNQFGRFKAFLLRHSFTFTFTLNTWTLLDLIL